MLWLARTHCLDVTLWLDASCERDSKCGPFWNTELDFVFQFLKRVSFFCFFVFFADPWTLILVNKHNLHISVLVVVLSVLIYSLVITWFNSFVFWWVRKTINRKIMTSLRFSSASDTHWLVRLFCSLGRRKCRRYSKYILTSSFLHVLFYLFNKTEETLSNKEKDESFSLFLWPSVFNQALQVVLILNCSL